MNEEKMHRHTRTHQCHVERYSVNMIHQNKLHQSLSRLYSITKKEKTTILDRRVHVCGYWVCLSSCKTSTRDKKKEEEKRSICTLKHIN